MPASVRKAPGYLKRSVMYQIFLRPFTPGGTLNSAAEMLPHLASLGVDILYLCPVTEADDDMRPEFWSDRQKACGLGNPKNPYRVGDYYRIDPEYGTDADLKRFTAYAHELGMRVILDLVYYHCGPGAVFIPDHPDFVKRDADGSIRNGRWHFPELNFDSPALREYLLANMEYFIREFDVDGYRCDVADAVPIDFWEEGRRRIETLKPDVMMLAESMEPADQIHAFDLNYSFSWGHLYEVFAGKEPAAKITEVWREYRDHLLPGARAIRATENHDIANDRERPDKTIGVKAHDAMFVINFGLDGVPFLYNGQEIADTALHSIWGNRFYGKDRLIDWSRAMTPEGKARFALLQKLIELRHAQPALSEGAVTWLSHDKPDAVLAFSRTCPLQNLIVVVNCRSMPLSVRIDSSFTRVSPPEVLLARGADFSLEGGTLKTDLLPYGFLMAQY